jgi:hypothetical protein
MRGREAWRKRKATVDEIHRFAKVCRVSNAMPPCLKGAMPFLARDGKLYRQQRISICSGSAL